MSSFKQNILDQTLHAAWAFFALLPLVIYPDNLIAGGLSGLLLALPREIIDQWPIGHIWDTVLDLSFFFIGGVLVVFIWGS